MDWTSVEVGLPESNERVLAIKELKNGRREICIAYCIRDYRYHDYVEGKDVTGPYWVTGGGNNNVIMWMQLPEIPKDEKPAEEDLFPRFEPDPSYYEENNGYQPDPDFEE